LQADAFADPERAGAQEHHAGDQVAQRLLSGETEHDGSERTADSQRAGVQARDPQGGQPAAQQGEEPDDEADGAGRGGVHAAKERRGGGAADVARQCPAEHDERQHGRRSYRRVEAVAEELVTIPVGDEDSAEQQ
jgi:hypothetical protein